MADQIFSPSDDEMEEALERAQEQKWDALKRAKDFQVQLAKAKERLDAAAKLIKGAICCTTGQCPKCAPLKAWLKTGKKEVPK